MTGRLALVCLLAVLAGCDEKSCGGGGGGAKANGFNAAALSAPERAKGGCKDGTCPLQASSKAMTSSGASRFIGAAPPETGSFESLEKAASGGRVKFDGAAAKDSPPPVSSCPGGVCRRPSAR